MCIVKISPYFLRHFLNWLSISDIVRKPATTGTSTEWWHHKQCVRSSTDAKLSIYAHDISRTGFFASKKAIGKALTHSSGFRRAADLADPAAGCTWAFSACSAAHTRPPIPPADRTVHCAVLAAPQSAPSPTLAAYPEWLTFSKSSLLMPWLHRI